MDLSQIVFEDADKAIFRVHRSALTSPEILEIEWSRLFEKSWLYLGHVSELPSPGDYLRRTIANRPLIFLRDMQGSVRVFFNSCPHRGTNVCREDRGNAAGFTCFYHGWSFDMSGTLVGVPDHTGYSQAFLAAGHSLASPRFDSYRGMYFVYFGTDAPSLEDYLGNAREIIDLTLDSAELLGGWQVIRGTAQFDVQANWKLLVENSVDNYHFATVHRSFTEFEANRRARLGVARPSVNRIDNSRGLAFGNGHVGMTTQATGRTIASPNPIWSEEIASEVRALRQRLDERFGAERSRVMCETSRFLIIFPNVAFQDTQSGFRIRQIWPISADRMSVMQWELVPRNEQEALAARRRESSVTFLGGGGFGTPDDIEALESCQLGFRAGAPEWSDMSRGMQRVARSDDELTARGFWREWHARMMGRAHAERSDDLPPASDVAPARGGR